MTAHDRLSALDAGFLSLEGPDTPMHVGSVTVFEGAPLRDDRGRIRLSALRSLVEERLDLVPRFRQIPVAPVSWLGRPFWADDAHFDISRHVLATTVPAPGGRTELLALAAALHGDLLDRSRPLWELWIVDGLADGRVGLVQKVHHSMVDGIAGVDVATAMMDLDRGTAGRGARRRHRTWTAGPGVNRPESARALVGDSVALPVAVIRQAARLVTHPVTWMARAGSLARGAASLADAGVLAPRASINRPFTGPRRVLDSVTVSLPETKALGAACTATVNDVVLALVAGGLRRLLSERGEQLLAPHVLVPVSTRAPSQRGQVGNSVAAMVTALPVAEPDPVRRVRTVSAAMRRRKAVGQAGVTGALMGFFDLVPAPLAAVVAGAVHRQPFVNLVVTNVPGSPLPLFMLGARLEEVVPIVPLARNLDLSVGILSYMDQLTFGLFGDADRVPDLHVLTEGIEKSMAELASAVPT